MRLKLLRNTDNSGWKKNGLRLVLSYRLLRGDRYGEKMNENDVRIV